MVVLHGGPGAHHEYLLPQLLFLAESRDCLLYDQRGGGRSKTDDRTPITWHTHVDDLRAVLAECAPGPLTLVGYSWGALLALLYTMEAAASRAGPMPARLVLLDPAPASRAFRARFEAEFARRQAGPEVQALRAALEASGLRDHDPAAYRQRTFELSVAGYFADPARARPHAVPRDRPGAAIHLGVARRLRPPADAADAARADARGARTAGSNPARIRGGDRRRARCGALLLDDCGHVPYVEQPAALREAVSAFLDATEGLVTG